MCQRGCRFEDRNGDCKASGCVTADECPNIAERMEEEEEEECEYCHNTGEIVAVEYMGSYQMTYCPYCEAGQQAERDEALDYYEEQETLCIDMIDTELFW